MDKKANIIHPTTCLAGPDPARLFVPNFDILAERSEGFHSQRNDEENSYSVRTQETPRRSWDGVNQGPLALRQIRSRRTVGSSFSVTGVPSPRSL